ncbi:MAG: ABC transporter permease [Thermomicrobiales bacterium]|nr:ABC transporter permease [Thermomicrobiales bacterium]
MWKIWERFGILIILLAFGVALTVLTDTFLTPRNLLNVARQVSVLSLISLGLLVVLITGNVDLTVGAFLGLAGALFAGWSIAFGIVPALLMGFGTAVVVGSINGFLSTRGRNLSVIVTLAMMTMIQGATLLYTDGRPITGFPESMRVVGTGYLGPIPAPVVIAVAAAVVVQILLQATGFGRELYAIGGNTEAARLSGVPVTRRVIATFVISALLSALAGLVLIGRVSSAQPTAGIGDELNAVGAVLIGGASLSGGAGSVVGTLAGVLILGMISNGLNLLNVNPYYQYVIKGLIILFAILMDQWGRR